MESWKISSRRVFKDPFLVECKVGSFKLFLPMLESMVPPHIGNQFHSFQTEIKRLKACSGLTREGLIGEEVK